MTDFIISYGILIIAVIALVQPYIWALWKRYFRQGEIMIHQTGHIEAGFDLFGPSICLIGTLRSVHQDLFVQSIRLELNRHKDSSHHIFEWGVFQSEKITVSGEPQGTFEIPYGFMLLTSSPRRFYIRFYDTQVQSEMHQIISKVREEWWEKITAKFKPDELRHLSSQHTASFADLEERLAKLWEEYSKGELYVQSYDALSRMCYWEGEKYTLKVVVQTSKPDRSFERSWSFTLTEKDACSIRLNVIKLLQITCGRPSFGQPYVAYPKYA